MKIKDYINKCYKDMKAMEDHELATYKIPKEEAAMSYIILCLANPKSEGSKEVLTKIVMQRESKKDEL